MRERKAARLLVVSPSNEVLLFRFEHEEDALAGTSHWATPGGGVEEGETFHAAAIRELQEETGIRLETVAPPVADRTVSLMLPSGEWVTAVEQYFVVHVGSTAICRAGWTGHEAKVMKTHRWWSAEALMSTNETIWPENLLQMLREAGVSESPAESAA
ncbi:NUDIX hydrolase [Pseudomonas sp. Marseille-QA0892]